MLLILAQSAWHIAELLLASTQLFYLRDAHQELCQQHGTDSAIRDLGAEWRGVLYWERTDLGFDLGFLPICSDYCQVFGSYFPRLLKQKAKNEDLFPN